ncbi:serine carboxypeptidase s28 domain-containing protein [Ditylenchus destructor]|nr:serine carboxypeptidase s28 domain-containing protein [Ditylenchus destructor]
MGTSEECHHSTKLAFEDIRNATYYSEGRAELSRVFRIDPPLTANPNDLRMFLYMCQMNFECASQNGTQQLGRICQIMNDNAIGRMQRVANVIDFVGCRASIYKNETTDVNYERNMEWMRNTSIDFELNFWRGWIWLCCNELGYFHTTDGNGIFGDLISLGSYVKYCVDMFGSPMSPDYIQERVALTQHTYGLPADYNESNVCFTRGTYDPWISAGISTSRPEQHQILLTSKGASHMHDMFGPMDSEPADLALTRQRIREEVTYYLNSALQSEPERTNGSVVSSVPAGFLLGLWLVRTFVPFL